MALILTYNNSSLGQTIQVNYDSVGHAVLSGGSIGFNPALPYYSAGQEFFSQVVGGTTYSVRAQNSSPYAYVVTVLTGGCSVTIDSVTPANASTNQASDGTIHFDLSSPYAGALYTSINGGSTWQLWTGSPYTGLHSGQYVVNAKLVKADSTVCYAGQQTVTIGYNAVVCDLVIGNITKTSSPGATLTIVDYATVAVEPVEYRLDLGAWQTSNIFTGLAAATYSVQLRFKNFTSCAATPVSVVISNAVSCDIAIQAVLVTAELTKYGKNGALQVSATSTHGTITYSKDNGSNYQASNLFNSLPPGSYIIKVKDAANCTAVLTVVVPAYKTPTVDFPHANSHRVVIMSGPVADQTGYQNYDNTLMASMRFSDRETCPVYQKIIKNEVTGVQWRSNYASHLFQLFKVSDGSLVDTLPCVQKSSFTGKLQTGTAYFTTAGAGYTQVFFDNGLPELYEVGMGVTIAGVTGLNGVYTIKDILPGTLAAVGYQVLLLQLNYTPVATISTGTLSSTYNVEDWEVWEAAINWNNYTANDQYYFVITGSDSQFANFTAQSEPVDLQISHSDTLLIEYLNFDNAFKIDYTTGIRHRLRVYARLSFPKPGGNIVGMEDSVRRYIKLQENVTRNSDFQAWDLPFYVAEKLSLAFAHDFVTIGGIQFATEDKLDVSEFDHSILVNATGKVREVNYEADNSADNGSSGGNDTADVIAIDPNTLLRVIQ